MTALPTVEELTFLMAMRLTIERWSSQATATVPVVGYTTEVRRDARRSGYEAFVWLPPGDENGDWVLNSYNSGIWPDGDTYPSLNAAASAILEAIREHRCVTG